MRRPTVPWESYINSQKYSECQVVTALNAWTYLTGRTLDPQSKRYERLVDVAKARHGSAISIAKVHNALGIEPSTTFKHMLFVAAKLPAALPLDLAVWHKRYGFHSVAVVDYEPRTDSYRIPNFDRATNMDGWIYGEDLGMLVSAARLGVKSEWVARSFKLVRTPKDESRCHYT